MSGKSPYMAQAFEWSKPTKVKEWAIKKLKEGVSARIIAPEIKRLFGVEVAVMTIYRWRNRYTRVTGERIAPWKEINVTPEQQRQNRYDPKKLKIGQNK